MKLLLPPLIEAIKRVSPALPTKSAVGAFLNIWFSKTSVWATDGVIGLDVPLDTGLEGGILGEPLLAFLKTLSVDELEVITGSGSALLSAGRAKVTLPYSPPQEYVWRYPAVDPDEFVVVPAALPGVLKRMLAGVSKSSPFPDRNGVTLKVFSGLMNIYATDNATISSSMIPVEWPDGNYVLSQPFCEEFLKVTGAEGQLTLSSSSIVALGEGDTLLYGSLINVDAPTPYERYMIKYAPAEVLQSAVALPPDLAAAVKRSAAVARPKAVALRFHGNTITLSAEGPTGQFEEAVETDELFKRAVSYSVGVPFLNRITSMCSRLALSDDCIIGFGEDDFTLLVSARAA